MKKKVCMIVQDSMVKGGIASVVNGYKGSKLEEDYEVIYVESYKDGGKLTKILKAIKGYLHFMKVLLVDKPELVHIHSSFGPSFYRKLPFIFMASWSEIPIFNHIHGADFEEFYLNASEKKKIQIKKVYGKCSKLLALSEEWKEKLSQIVPSQNIVILENHSILHEDALEGRLMRKSTNTVLFLGELGRRKGCYDIPAVVEKVVTLVPNVKFILCGAGSAEDESNIKKLFEEKGLETHVEFLGWVRDKEKDKVLRETDLFFLPSYNEGMPMSILDAMGYGMPVVSTNVGGIPKLVHDGENGICCDAGDIETMAVGIAKILTNQKLRDSFAALSFKIAKEGYSLEKHIDKLETIYSMKER